MKVTIAQATWYACMATFSKKVTSLKLGNLFKWIVWIFHHCRNVWNEMTFKWSMSGRAVLTTLWLDNVLGSQKGRIVLLSGGHILQAPPPLPPTKCNKWLYTTNTHHITNETVRPFHLATFPGNVVAHYLLGTLLQSTFNVVRPVSVPLLSVALYPCVMKRPWSWSFLPYP